MSTNKNMNENAITVTTALKGVTLTDVNKAILATVPETLKAVTETFFAANQFNTGVSLVMCEMLFRIQSDTATLKASPYKNFSNYCDIVLRIDKAQASRYAKMYEVLYYDVDEPYEKLKNGGGFSTAQLVEISKVKDRIIRKLFIQYAGLSPKVASSRISKTVKELNTYDKEHIENINWNDIQTLLDGGTLNKNETATETATANSCNFTNMEELTNWIEKNPKAIITSIVVTYER